MTIENCTIANNQLASSDAAGAGGGIYNAATMTVLDSSITANTMKSGSGGGIDNDQFAQMEVSNSTIDHNSALQGGGVMIDGNTNLVNCTIADNTAKSNGGGVYVDSTSNVAAINCTIAFNFVQSVGTGGGIANVEAEPALIVLDNTIVAMNANPRRADDIFGSVSNKSAYNLIGNEGSGRLTSTSGNQGGRRGYWTGAAGQ